MTRESRTEMSWSHATHRTRFVVAVRTVVYNSALLYLNRCNVVKQHDQVRSQVFTAVTMKNAVFWDVGPCRSCVNRRFGGTSVDTRSTHAGSSLTDFSTLKMEATRSAQTTVHTISTRRQIPEDGILSSY
jgi:hypothetical protein